MAELILFVDDDVLEQALRRAAEEGVSLDSVVGNYLDAYGRRVGRTWTRADLYEERLRLSEPARRTDEAGAD